MRFRAERVVARGLAAMALASCSSEHCVVTEQRFEVTAETALRLADRDAGMLADPTPCRVACARLIDDIIVCAVPELLSCSGSGADGTSAPFSCQVRLTECTIPGGAVCGRRPEGWRDAVVAAGDPTAAWWARQVRLEHASIAAFARLADELTAHHAPATLIAGARRARRDEVRHARTMAAFARRAGAAAARPGDAPRATVRPLAAMAEENAVEGCVRETFGAMVAAWQAKHARDPLARASFSVIARDEARHAALAWRVHGWAAGRLSQRDRAALDGAMRAALAGLAGEISVGAAPALRDAGLWPDGRALRAALSTLARELA
jgi:hypothetical protein